MHCPKVLEDFSSRVEPSLWTEGNAACAAYSGLEPTLQRYQNPREADALTKVQEELDETKIILVSVTTSNFNASLTNSMFCISA